AAWLPPDLGAGQFSLTFTVPSRHWNGFQADPIVWAGEQSSPIATITPTGPRGWRWLGDGSFYWFTDGSLLSHSRPKESGNEAFRYRQEWRPGNDPDLSPPFRLSELNLEDSLRTIRNNPVPRVKEYADTVLEEMIRDGKLPADFREPIHLLPRVQFHDKIATAFSYHLATTPTLTYTTSLHREMKNIDPIEEFLFHTRAGHCERFASALALMLRSEGIPAVMVLGFKGCEPTEEPGKYVVREAHAHAWVAALIQEFGPPTGTNQLVSRWRSLDPTPSGSIAEESNTGSVWTQPAVSWLRSHFRTYISEYTGEERRRALAELITQATRIEIFAIAVALVAAAVLLRGLLRHRKKQPTSRASPHAEWFARLVSTLSSGGFKPTPGETPLEFATRAAIALRKNTATVEVAEVPLDWVETYYESRFGDKPFPQDRRATLESRLEALIAALAHGY
ncbi:MAG TPA: transglutaminase domain-containing protein, partial [Gemmata sp.]|nr:transglutaminase domain-containing protein [Gemmata sp.]